MPFEADDLEDGFEIDQGLLSQEEAPVDAAHVVEELERTKKKKKKQKRKLVDAEEDISKKRRKLDVNEGKTADTVSIALQSPAVQAEYVFTLFQKIHKTLSSLELEEMRINESAFIDTRSYVTERSVDQLGQFISDVAPTLLTRLTQRSASKGAPTVLFITSSAIRAADVTRSFRPLRGPKSGEVAKLFAKHFKLSEHAKYLENTLICAGVGTAGRIGKLLSETGSLSVKALTHVIIDTHLDAKQRSIFDIPETLDALIKDVLSNSELRKAIESRKASIVLF